MNRRKFSFFVSTGIFLAFLLAGALHQSAQAKDCVDPNTKKTIPCPNYQNPTKPSAPTASPTSPNDLANPTPTPSATGTPTPGGAAPDTSIESKPPAVTDKNPVTFTFGNLPSVLGRLDSAPYILGGLILAFFLLWFVRRASSGDGGQRPNSFFFVNGRWVTGLKLGRFLGGDHSQRDEADQGKNGGDANGGEEPSE